MAVNGPHRWLQGQPKLWTTQQQLTAAQNGDLDFQCVNTLKQLGGINLCDMMKHNGIWYWFIIGIQQNQHNKNQTSSNNKSNAKKKKSEKKPGRSPTRSRTTLSHLANTSRPSSRASPSGAPSPQRAMQRSLTSPAGPGTSPAGRR